MDGRNAWDRRAFSGAFCSNSVALIDACRPYGWYDDFPPVVEASPELKAAVAKKWRDVIGPIG